MIRCMLRSEAEPADGAYESMFRPEMLERERQRHREGIRRKVSTDVRALDEPKESTHEGHVKDPWDAMAAMICWVCVRAACAFNCHADRIVL